MFNNIGIDTSVKEIVDIISIPSAQ